MVHFYALKLAWEKEKKIFVVSDCVEGVSHILNHDPNFPMADLVSLIHNLMHEEWDDLQFFVIHASTNRVVLEVAKSCIYGDGGVDDMMRPPLLVRAIVDDEPLGGWVRVCGVVGCWVSVWFRRGRLW